MAKSTKSTDQPVGEKRAGRSPVLWVGLGCGGLFLLSICCAGVGAVGYFALFSGPAIAGKWEIVNKFDRSEWEFHRNGTGTVRMTTEFEPGQVKNTTGYFNYKLSKGEPPVLEVELTRAEGDVTEGIRRDIGKPVQFKVNLEKDSMKLTKIDPRLLFEDTVTLTRQGTRK